MHDILKFARAHHCKELSSTCRAQGSARPKSSETFKSISSHVNIWVFSTDTYIFVSVIAFSLFLSPRTYILCEYSKALGLELLQYIQGPKNHRAVSKNQITTTTATTTTATTINDSNTLYYSTQCCNHRHARHADLFAKQQHVNSS